MPKAQAASAPRVLPDDTSLNSPYEIGRGVLNEPALLGRRSKNLIPKARIWTGGVFIGVAVFVFALVLQWTIYDRFLHENGIRIVGSAIAAMISILLVVTLGMKSRKQRREEIARLETIALLNHHIRNALQAIVSVSGSTDSTDVIRRSVERIEWALGEVSPDLSGCASQNAQDA